MVLSSNAAQQSSQRLTNQTTERMNIENGPRGAADIRLHETVEELLSIPQPVDAATLKFEPAEVDRVVAGVADPELHRLVSAGDCQDVQRYFWAKAHEGAFDQAMLLAYERWWSGYHAAFVS